MFPFVSNRTIGRFAVCQCCINATRTCRFSDVLVMCQKAAGSYAFYVFESIGFHGTLTFGIFIFQFGH